MSLYTRFNVNGNFEQKNAALATTGFNDRGRIVALGADGYLDPSFLSNRTVNASVGSLDAGKIPLLDASGFLNESFMPLLYTPVRFYEENSLVATYSDNIRNSPRTGLLRQALTRTLPIAGLYTITYKLIWIGNATSRPFALRVQDDLGRQIISENADSGWKQDYTRGTNTGRDSIVWTGFRTLDFQNTTSPVTIEMRVGTVSTSDTMTVKFSSITLEYTPNSNRF